VTVFLSYAREDVDLARYVCEELTELRHDVAIDNEIRGGNDWWNQLCDWIQGCDVFVIILSDAWMHSEPCQAELAYATALQRPLLPLAVDGLALDGLPIELKRWQIIPYDRESKDSYKQMVVALAGLGEPPPLPDPLPERPPLPESYADPFRRALAAPSLSVEDQVSIFAVLKLHSADPRRQDESVSLIRELRARRDLAVGVADDIDAFLAAVTPVTEAEVAAADAGAGPEIPLATVTLTRIRQRFTNRAGSVHLEIEGERVASVDNGETVTVTVPAGPHTLQAVTRFEAIGSRSNELDVVLAPGSETYLRVRFKSSLNAGLELLQTVSAPDAAQDEDDEPVEVLDDGPADGE
jgi:hypothetical protein